MGDLVVFVVLVLGWFSRSTPGPQDRGTCRAELTSTSCLFFWTSGTCRSFQNKTNQVFPLAGIRDSKGTPKNFFDKDFAKLSGELSGEICLKILILLDGALSAPLPPPPLLGEPPPPPWIFNKKKNRHPPPLPVAPNCPFPFPQPKKKYPKRRLLALAFFGPVSLRHILQSTKPS